MKNKKSIIDTYETIYRIDLIVANKYTTLEELKELYIYPDGEELDENMLQGSAVTCRAKRKSDDRACLIVKYNTDVVTNKNQKVELINTISHEAGHVCLDIYEYIDQHICNCSPEPFCYLLGWAAECIYTTWTKKK